MRQENWYDVDSFQGSDFSLSTAFPVLMRKVFAWMTLALVITGITAFGVATTPALMQLIFSSRLTFFGLIGLELVLVLAVSSAVSSDRISLTMATLLFVLYSVVNGTTLASIFFAFELSSIATVFFVTAATFGIMSLVGYTTKTDLTSFGKLFFMALIGIIIATIVNIFLGNAMLDMIICYAGVLVFVGLTAYDVQKIKEMCQSAPDTGETMQKLALFGALTLYLDFINLFLYLLKILGNRRN